MDYNNQKTTGATTTAVDVNMCSINICGMSERSRFCLDNYCQSKSLDVLAVQESGTQNNELLKVCNMGYMLDNNTSTNKGCALYINKKHSYKQLDICPRSTEFDYIWSLVIMYGKRYIIGTAYVKPDKPQLIRAMICMVNNVCNIEAKKHKALGVILMGDFNARHYAWEDKRINNNGKELMGQLDPVSLTIHAPSSPSYLCINGDSIIDLVITSNNIADNMSRCKTDETAVLFSGAPMRGHVPIHMKLKIRGASNKTVVKEQINLDKIDWEKWKADLEDAIDSSNNQGLLMIDNPGDYWKTLIENINTVTTQNTQTKKTCCHSKPYWTKELSRLAKCYRNAQKCWNKRNTDTNKTNLEEAKENFESKRREECHTFIMKNTKDLNTAQTRDFWKSFKKIFGKEKDDKVEILEDTDGNLVDDDEEKEKIMFKTFFEGEHLKKEKFDEVFYNKVLTEYNEAKLTKFTNSSSVHLNIDNENDSNSHRSFNDPIKESEVRYVLKYKKSSGKSFDEVNSKKKTVIQ